MEKAVWAETQSLLEPGLAIEFAKPRASENASPWPGVGAQSLLPRGSPPQAIADRRPCNLCPRTCLILGSTLGERPQLSPAKHPVGLSALIEMAAAMPDPERSHQGLDFDLFGNHAQPLLEVKGDSGMWTSRCPGTWSQVEGGERLKWGGQMGPVPCEAGRRHKVGLWVS